MTKKILIITALLALSQSLALGQGLSEAIWHMKQDCFLSAKKILVEYVHSHPDDAEGLFYLGQVYYALNQKDTALQCYNEGLAADPAQPLNYIGLGKISLDSAKRDEWYKLYSKGKKYAQDRISYLLDAAEACLSTQTINHDLAAKYLEEARDADPYNPRLYLLMGDLALTEKTPGDALNEYERAIYYDQNYAEAFVMIGRINAQARNFPEALKSFNQALLIDPQLIQVHKDRGDLYYTFGKYQDARTDYEFYLKRGDVNDSDQERYAFILFFCKDYVTARSLIDKLLQSHPEITVLYRIKGYIDFEDGDYASSLESLQYLMENHDPSKIIAIDHIYYGRLLIKSDQDSLGILELQKALEMDSTNHDLREEIAKTYSKQKKHLASIAMYKELVSSKAGNLSNLYYQIGKEFYFLAEDTTVTQDTLQRKDYYHQADSSFRKVIELSPESYIGYIWCGRIQSKFDPESLSGLAKPFYEQAMNILERTNGNSSQKLLIECYRYLAFYFFIHSEGNKLSNPSESAGDISRSLDYWGKILELDPADSQAKTAVENLN